MSILIGFLPKNQQSLERKADKHLARQDDVLVRAIVRVWKARERGQLLERVGSTRLLKRFWRIWQERIAANRSQEG
jgi:protein SFI1